MLLVASCSIGKLSFNVCRVKLGNRGVWNFVFFLVGICMDSGFCASSVFGESSFLAVGFSLFVFMPLKFNFMMNLFKSL